MFTQKIDSSGRYLPFPGLTAVADVFRGNMDIFQHFHDRLSACSAITDYTALLPAESYHITAFGITEQRSQTPSEWTDWLSEHLNSLHDLHLQMEQHTRPYEFRIVKAQGRRLTLIVEIESMEAAAERHVASTTQKYQVRVPRTHHISLGYPYRKFENKIKEKQFTEEFQNIFVDVFSSDWQSARFTANQPRLCFYNDMTAFIPWDATAPPQFSSLINEMNGITEAASECKMNLPNDKILKGPDKLKFPFPPYS
jgi:hypothetical protein